MSAQWVFILLETLLHVQLAQRVMPVCQPVLSRLPVVMVTIAWREIVTVLNVKQDMPVWTVKVLQGHVIQVHSHYVC